jgi:hypothetical protein
MRAFVIVAALVLCGCNTTSESETVSTLPPDAKAIILAHKGRLWKDPDSIKGASIAAPIRHMNMMWHVCVRANARGGFGGYTGEKESLIGIYDDGRPPEGLMADAGSHCERQNHVPFPELDGGYKPAPTTAKR